MSGIITDLSVNTPWQVASGFINTFTITCTSGGSAFSLATRAFSLQIRKPGETTNVINLTEGAGITNGGASGVLTIALTAAQSATLGTNVYDWQLTCITDSTRWINGTVNSTTGTYDGSLATDLTAEISVTGTAVALAITLGGVSFTWGEGTGTLSDQTDLQTALDAKQALVNSATALVDGATIDLTAIKHTLATAASRTFTISYTGDDITLEVTLSATSATQTFPATALCVSDGVASGDNTLAMAGVSGDKYMIAIKKVGSAYYVVGKNFGQ